MEPLPKGANFVRGKTLWEIGLHIAGNPATPYGGNRDMVITVGSGSGETFRPWLRLATGSAILAEDVANGGVEAAFVNPSALLTQAYRGVGLFKQALPLRIIASYPSWDRMVFAVHPRAGIRSLADIKNKRYPLRISVREDPTHSTLVLIDQAFALHGFARQIARRQLHRIDRMAREVLDAHGHVDILVNNAGKSIRRSVSRSYDRFHDYQRTMQLNYFGPLKLILDLLPSMRERHSGHIVNVSTMGLQFNTPRFAAYLDSFTDTEGAAR